MVYIHSWQEFQDAAEALYSKSPNDVGTLLCKMEIIRRQTRAEITDNATCLKFKTNSSIFLNRFESLNLSLMQKMQNQRRREEIPSVPVVASEALAPTESDHASLLPAQLSAIPTASPSAGGVKKKKPKKKK